MSGHSAVIKMISNYRTSRVKNRKLRSTRTIKRREKLKKRLSVKYARCLNVSVRRASIYWPEIVFTIKIIIKPFGRAERNIWNRFVRIDSVAVEIECDHVSN